MKSSGDAKAAAEAILQAHRVESDYKFNFLKEKIAMERALGGEITIESVIHEH